jgi:hypothetical protein
MVIDSKILGSFNGQFVKMNDATAQAVVLNDFFPAGTSLPRSVNAIQALSYIACFFIFMTLSFTFYFFGSKHYRKRTTSYAIHLVGTVWWTIGLLLKFVMQYATVQTDVVTMQSLSYAFLAFATLYSVLQTDRAVNADPNDDGP